MEFRNESFGKQTMNVDGNSYVNCSFDVCKFVYSGGELPTWDNLETDTCYWMLDGAAKRTVEFLRGMYHGDPRDRAFAEHILKVILEPPE